MTDGRDGKAAPPEAAARHTNWRRFAVTAGGALMAAAGLLSAIAAGLLQASIALSGAAFKVSADDVRLEGVTLYPGAIGGSARRGAVVATARGATMSDLCQSMLVPTPLGNLTVRMTAGEDRPVTATSLVMDAEHLGADVELTGMEFGGFGAGDAALPKARPGLLPTAGGLRVRHLRVAVWSSSAGSFRMPGMRVSVKPGRHECF